MFSRQSIGEKCSTKKSERLWERFYGNCANGKV